MKRRFPSPFFILFRRLTAAISFGRVLSWGWLGKILSTAFSFVVTVRHKLFYSSPYRVSSLVVSVGNVVLGGSGKTPTVLWLAEALQARGYSCAVLSRGYKSRCSRQRKLTIVDPLVHDATYVGDEPLLVAKKLPSGTVFIHKDRRISAQQAEKDFDILILDDGFQNRRLHKDMELVVVNGQDPLGGGEFFPRGRLRDSLKRLKDADFIVVNGSCSSEDRQKLSSWCCAPRIYVEPRISQVVWEPSGVDLPVQDLRGLAVGVFCGLGFPRGFLDMLKNSGVKVLGTYLLPDHAGITKKELHFFCAKMAMRQAQGILYTEKDGEKLGANVYEPGMLPLGKVCMQFSFIDSEETTLSLLNQIDQLYNSKR
ncbi:Tetraacyldisaccharide 4'-kinase [Chlamydia avium]|uniref:Tetraacyldisaccharide 4'-kinase n=1 Tax=Chlamydia avium TaxID=1457141 RepID=A0ABN0MSW2_9CHLA|nr:tetraacyldisaccharide 4'-kinase [Chlamydia avium]EPP37774.1 tetraacyldisaccharide 4'-kinase [Chlamydia psittaci 10_743_SC13]EPP38548.1 tetraacyldisaccharide 4'-kinase [Chlamydia avium]VVT42539.1 Tetraacyldisaccharide 4'-kinase [Chlamydia avium]